MSSVNVKTAIVTGGTGALGKYVVEKFCAEGYKVYIPVTSLKKFMQIFDSSLDENSEFTLRKIYAFECDALDEESVNEFVEKVFSSLSVNFRLNCSATFFNTSSRIETEVSRPLSKFR